jgi:FtsH-binding integral membrane protein
MVNSSLYNNLFNTGSKKGGSKSSSTFINIFNEKKELLVYTFANLIVQLGITYYVMEKTPVSKDDKNTRVKNLIYFIIQIGIIFALALIPMHSIFKFLLFCVFSYTWGLSLSILKLSIPDNIIKFALFGTISIFAIMFCIGTLLIMTGIKLGLQFGLVLFYLLLFLILFQLINLFNGKSSIMTKGLSIIGILLFSVYIIYDTNKILQRNYSGDFITASLDYYLDILNIFVDLLSFNSN